ncbi:DUF1015 domain-containing protein [Mesohalobacter halotolerans]|uniref:DUF1015 domain-containing protein n=1 Tax=Mesohalobacter halotolerans TaxID=1883405 RepID=A0A4U5TPR8_9FLAO|nr:DUF1015 domain-containing protein [Mesohalobacter halotolerans]TKS56150.1 DUF1015 domain-containing protein [Mesohalobacter halotolerans]
MPLVKAFKATRPTRDKVSLIASRAYETYSKKEREARLDHNPFSFLHIVNPGYKYQKEVSGRKRFGLVKNRFQEFKEDGIFNKDDTPSIYIHRIVYRNEEVFTGLVAKSSCQDYIDGKIKKHEDTILEREKTFSEYLKTVRFNADPVLLTYPKRDSINQIIERYCSDRSEYEFTTTSRETHYLWLIKDENDIKNIEHEFAEMHNIYIADGHHRCASSALLAQKLAQENGKNNGDEDYNYFMSYLISEDQLAIHEFNRLITDLNGLDKDEFLIKLDENFKIENRGETYYKPHNKHHFSMYLDGEFYSLYLRKSQYHFENALEQLDAQILYKTVLKPILNITDLKNDSRIDYIKGQKDMAYVKSAIDQKQFAVGFGMLPPTIEEIKSIADEGLVMPPKTTYIDPKLRSGVTIYEF